MESVIESVEQGWRRRRTFVDGVPVKEELSCVTQDKDSEREERQAWDRYAAATLNRWGNDVAASGLLADAMLAERRKRYPVPGACEWQENASGTDCVTGCGKELSFVPGMARRNWYAFCPYCGQRISVKGGAA